MPNIGLTPELERFAEARVRSGRYDSVSEVTRAAFRLLQDAEQQRTGFLAMLDAAEAEGERDGFAQIADLKTWMAGPFGSSLIGSSPEACCAAMTSKRPA
ncbi:MAG TPA: type II toxin-antitoxin system ParD family antitoxin [Acetobacteraceae bacterium]|nr:type II toxin-antitoxin system ParD family antitoxin [Acetobacteraceae bacterium]